MADEAIPPPSTEAAAPAAPAPDQVSIALGPDLGIYPAELRPAEPAPPAPAPAPEAAEVEPSETPPTDAGPEVSPAPQGEMPQGSRRRANEDAYQRGLAEGRAAIQRELEQQQQRELATRTQQEANQRVEQLFNDLQSGDYATQDRARRGILQMYNGNRQAQALMQTTRQQVLAEMATDFSNLRDLDGISDADYQALHSAPSAAELAKRALDIGRRSREQDVTKRDEQVARLEAEVEGLRGRLVGSRATPERANGAGSLSSGITIEQYLALSPKDASKLTSAQIDALTAQLQADAARSRS